MSQSNEKIYQLNELLTINYNVESIYLDAMGFSKNTGLKHFFRARAFERNEFCRYLSAEIRQLGGSPIFNDLGSTETTSISLDFRKLITNQNHRKLFEEIRKIKSFCIEQYNKTLNNFDFQESVKSILERQRDAISSSISLSRYTDELSKKPNKIISKA